MDKNKLHRYQEFLFDLVYYIAYALIILSAFGMSEYTSKYLSNLDYYIRIYICLFLIWRFNPFRSHYEFTDLDRKIAFSAGAIILTTTALNEYIEEIKSFLQNMIK